MKLTVTAFTTEDSNIDLEQFKIFSGKQAGICYMSETYFSEKMTNQETAKKRFERTIPNLHHSIADHVNVTILLEDMPKIVAMILNSLRQYSTSEKSGRYTIMKGNSEREVILYEKWKNIFEKEIKIEYPRIDEKTITKLAMENARYLLSVFTPTTMAYTTSIRQWNYIMDWCDRFIKKEPINKFEELLGIELANLKELLSFLYIDGLRDAKGKSFEFLALQTNSPALNITEEYFGDTYTAIYNGTFVELAQAQRHRTLKYNMIFDPDNLEFYIPPIIIGTELEQMWKKDIESLSDIYPQGALVKIIERGITEDFLLKCQERLCGRAQLEIALQTNEILQKIYKSGAMTSTIKDFINKDGSSKTKCQVLNCQEPCFWGSRFVFKRKI